MKCTRLPFLIASACAVAASAKGVDRLHMRTSPDSFLHVQYTSKAEFLEGLRAHPAALKAMAKCVHVSPDTLYTYVEHHLHLAKTSTSAKFLVWGWHEGHLYKETHWFKAGLPVWATEDGTPVLRWLCGNPMVTALPPAATPPPPPPAPEPQPTPPPPPPPPAPEPTPPPPPPPPAPEPEPTPPPPPPPAPAPQPTPPPPPPPMPKPPMAAKPYEKEYGIQVGILQWNDVFGGSKGYFTGGLSYDPVQFGSGGRLGLYLDAAGIFQSHPVYEWYGGGVDYKEYLTSSDSAIQPYVGVGVGVYHLDLYDAAPKQDFTRVGGKAFIGFQVKDGFFVEGEFNYFGVKHLPNRFNSSRDLSRPSISIGFRF